MFFFLCCAGWYFFQFGYFMQLSPEEDSLYLLLQFHIAVMCVHIFLYYWMCQRLNYLLFKPKFYIYLCMFLSILFVSLFVNTISLSWTVGTLPCCCGNTAARFFWTPSLYISWEYIWYVWRPCFRYVCFFRWSTLMSRFYYFYIGSVYVWAFSLEIRKLESLESSTKIWAGWSLIDFL